jgi:hypothetical protein
MQEVDVKQGMTEETPPPPKETQAPQIICPYCGADPALFFTNEFPKKFPNGAVIVLLVVACSKCRKALSGQITMVPGQPKVQIAPSPITMDLRKMPGQKKIIL